MADAAQIFERLTAVVRTRLPQGITPEYFDGFVTRNRGQLVSVLGDALAKREARIRARQPAAPATKARPADLSLPPERWSVGERTRANLAAMHLLASKDAPALTDDDRRILAAYSGWGGLSIDDVADQFPAGMTPEQRGLIHEYYTPSVVTDEVARIVAPRVRHLPRTDADRVLALEPSAGIGRFVQSFNRPEFAALDWRVVEYSQLSGQLLQALRPELRVAITSFEEWAADNEGEYRGRLGLVVSNPPYGQRGAAVSKDTNRLYREKRAYAYFLRRGLDLLAGGGLGVYLIPAGFLSGRGASARALRENVLRRHHLLAAFRLPSALFAGAMLVTDLILFEARGGVLPMVIEEDAPVLDGRYFVDNPGHVLGVERGSSDSLDKPRARFGYQVDGQFERIPDFVDRPRCTTCQVEPDRPARASGARASGLARRVRVDAAAAASPATQRAVQLGLRLDGYLAVAADPTESTVGLWRELVAALDDWTASNGNPWALAELGALSRDGDVGAARFLASFERSGTLIPGLRREPAVQPRFTGSPKDVVAQAEALYRTRPDLTLADVLAFHRSLGGGLTDELAVESRLLDAGWARDSVGAAGDRRGAVRFLPARDYLTGSLWPRYDRARAAADAGDVVAAKQAKDLLAAIAPVVYEDVTGVSPRQAWVPLDLVSAWLSETLNRRYGPIQLERRDGLAVPLGVDYGDLADALSTEAAWCVGWMNHDKTAFSPPAPPGTEKDEVRVRMGRDWEASFRAWVDVDADRRAHVVEAYNRLFRGFVAPTHSAEPLAIARWGRGAITPNPHQNAAARRVLTNRGGIVALDVGVGKTHTALMVIARARQDGWARRPVIVVPNSIVWQWYRRIGESLPDYNVVVIGSNRKIATRGARKGRLVDETDSPEERALKWTRFQAGEADVAVVTYTALGRTQVNEDELREYAERTAAIKREVALRRRNLQKKKKEKLTEREQAILNEGVAAWVAERIELPAGHRYDPGIAWDQLGIDLVVIDEAQNFKNLYSAGDREGGVPKYMGAQGEGSDRAWQLDFRLHSVRARTGGNGVVLLSATPAKNSPLELYNLVQFVDHDAWVRQGILDPEQFIDRYLRIELKLVPTPSLKFEQRGAVTGFMNLDELRSTIHRYAEFKTAEEAGIKLPQPKVARVEVDMTARQEERYTQLVAIVMDAMSNPHSGAARGALLGAMQRMALVAIHPDLDQGLTWASAGEASVDKHAPKLDACVKRILERRTCGHIVFCDNVAVHRMIRELLIDAGVPADGIGILNAEVAKTPGDRQRTADDFNGRDATDEQDEVLPKLDVVVANQVAYEGIDLQRRTCAIHHIDFPWEPATLQQRNGRGVRQGNRLGVIEIYYYFTRRSSDGIRFDMISRKRAWMVELLKSQDRETNNPAAQQDLGPEEMMLLISRNPEDTRVRLAELKARQAQEARAKAQDNAQRILRGAAGRYAQSRRVADPADAQRLRAEAEARLADLAQIDPGLWPWAKLALAARERDMIVPTSTGPPLVEGLRIALDPAAEGASRRIVEFGRVVDTSIGVRAPGEASWTLVAPEDLVAYADVTPAQIAAATAEVEPDVEAAIANLLRDAERYGQSWPHFGWYYAPEAWAAAVWERWRDRVLATLPRGGQKLPLVMGGRLVIGRSDSAQSGVTVLPPTAAGFARFVELAPQSDEPFTALSEAAEWWWARKVPRTLKGRGSELAEEEARAA